MQILLHLHPPHTIDNRPGLADTSDIDVFGFDQANNAWTDNSILDLSNPDNIYYKFNNTEGGAIIPRGSSLVGYDLRRTTVRPLYVPDPANTLTPRSALFNVTGGCYFWQFTMLDGDPNGIYNTSTVEPQSSWSSLVSPIRSHTKLTIFEFASQHDLFHFYRKVADSITLINAEKIEPKIQENRIVGALGDQVNIISVSRN